MGVPVVGDPRRLDALYVASVTFADWCVQHRLALVLVALPVTLLILIAIGRLILHDFPNSGDEYVYLYQAETLARGRLWNPSPHLPEFFEFSYIVQRDGKAFGSFPPGWPLLLALASRLHVPLWLVNPILGCLTLVAVYQLGRLLHDARVGMLAAWVTGISAFFLFNAASYFSHTLCGLLLLSAACLAAPAAGGRPSHPLLAGFLLGWAVLTRYFTAVVCGVPIVALLLRSSRHRGRDLLLLALGGLPWALTLLAYNAALTGSPWQLTTTESTTARWLAEGFFLRGVDILSTQILRFVLWTPPVLLLCYFIYLLPKHRKVQPALLDWMLVLVAVPLFFFLNRGGNQYGPRFYYEAFRSWWSSRRPASSKKVVSRTRILRAAGCSGGCPSASPLRSCCSSFTPSSSAA